MDELTGPYLDAAIAQVLDFEYILFNVGTDEEPIYVCGTKNKNIYSSTSYIRGKKKTWFGRVKPESLEPIAYIFSPSTDWNSGGIIFNRYFEYIEKHLQDVSTWPKGNDLLPYLMKAS